MEKTKRKKWVKKIKKHIGTHLIADFWQGKKIEDPKKIEEILFLAAKKSGNTPLKSAIHKFSPQGITGVVLLAESHIALHSWPEFDYLAIDIFSCGKGKMPEIALEFLRKKIKPKIVKIKKIKRGL